MTTFDFTGRSKCTIFEEARERSSALTNLPTSITQEAQKVCRSFTPDYYTEQRANFTKRLHVGLKLFGQKNKDITNRA